MNDSIRRIVIPVAAIAALGYGGAQLAGATGNQSTTGQPKPAVVTPANDGDTETADEPQGDGTDRTHPGEQVTGSDAEQAKAAALKAVPGGTVIAIHGETQDDQSQPDDRPEAGDTPDPSYEGKTAYDVEVKRGDGSTVAVHLDKAFAVLGTEAERRDRAAGGNDD